MLDVGDLGYDTWQTVYFQRATVLASELVLAYALQRYLEINIYIYKNPVDVPT